MKLQRSVSFTVYGIAQTKGSARGYTVRRRRANGAAYMGVRIDNDNPKAKAWARSVSIGAQTVAHHGLFLGPVELRIAFYLPRPKSLPKHQIHHTKKPDLSKLVRCLEDALTGVLYEDDAAIVKLNVSKSYAPIGTVPCAVVTLKETIAELGVQEASA